MLSQLINLYKKKSIIVMPLYKITRSKEFWRTYRFLKKTETWSKEQLEAWQLEQLKKIVDYAFLNVPYYNKKYSEIGYKIGYINSFDDFRSLPYITKDEIKANQEFFISKEIETIPHVWCTTSGSTDKPLKFIIDKYMNDKEQAYYYYYWEKYGYKIGDRRIVFRGHKVANINRLKFYERENISNTFRFDSDYLSSKGYFELYDRQIKKHKGDVLAGYPSSIYALAKNYEINHVEAPQFDLIILASENTYQNHVDYIKKVFKSKDVIYQYGHSEKILLAYKYKNREELGFSPTYGFMELDDQDQDVKEIVGTSFSKSMPFIRYKTGDFAKKSDYRSNDFMEKYTSVERIEGRLHEFVLTNDNRKISLVSIAGAHIPEFTIVKDMQYEQFEKGHLIVKVVEIENRQITDQEKQSIKQALESKLDYSINVEVKIIQEIEKTNRSKKIMLKQHLSI